MAEVEIKARENGPYLVPGQAKYVDADGNEQVTSGAVMALCRCGQSDTKPFCNGNHRKVGFQAPEVTLKLEE